MWRGLDSSGDRTARRMVGYCLALLVARMLPSALGWTGPFYFVGATVLGIGFLTYTLDFWRKRSEMQARRVLRASLIYLPALFTVVLVGGVFMGRSPEGRSPHTRLVFQPHPHHH